MDNDLNMRVVQRVDPFVCEILDNIVHVALYSFDEERKRWDRLNAEGPAVIYSRTSDPRHGLIIFNRIGIDHHVHYIDGNQSLMCTGEFIICRDTEEGCSPGSERTIGLWFTHRDEQNRTLNLWKRLISESGLSHGR